MRLFAALSLPDEIARPLLGTQHGVAGAAWRPRENLHITLCFYGEVTAALADELAQALSDITLPALNLTLGEGGAFGGNPPRALWMGLAPDPALDALAAQCRDAAQRLGLELEHRRYIPHITMAYCRGTTDVDAARYLERLAALSGRSFTVEQFTLYRSQLGRQPARYTPLADYALPSVL
jgi:RNA 2',3'-cyclic 3'-phosphodiesterase